MLLVLSLSLGNLAWATDSHDEALLGQAACAMHGGGSPADGDHGCDHCCHGVAHLLAVPFDMPELVVPLRAAQHLSMAADFHSRTAPPLLQPPRRFI